MTDGNVAARYGEAVGETALTVTIAPGEQSKNLSSADRVWTALAGAGMTRADHVLALGGGVVGDLAGFCAATYQRGVPVVQVPTTLVAQVDSAYGGKTGVDLPAAKNYVGAYHQPAGVLADPLALRTLPAQELAAGWVEVLKTALIAGGELWERVAARRAEVDGASSSRARARSSRWSPRDERDGGRRQVLNLGHTVGHAIETAGGYACTATARRSGSGCSPRCGSPARTICARRRAGCSRRGACPCAWKAWTWRPCWMRSGATRSAWAPRCRSCSCRRPARSRGAPVGAADLRAAVAELAS